MISAMLQYIQRSPDCFHAVEELRQRLLREGYTELRPGRWQEGSTSPPRTVPL